MTFHDSETAKAKINIVLQIIGRRADGYHELDSLVTFLDIGDSVGVEEDASLSLMLAGDNARSVETVDNLVLQAAHALQQAAHIKQGAKLTLQKFLPVGAGLGGGSADAAATLRLLNRFWKIHYPLEKLAEIGASLGADVPACVYSVPLRMQGVGEKIMLLENMPPFSCVVVYPALPSWTQEIYSKMNDNDFSGNLAHIKPDEDWLSYLRTHKNDLQPSAIRLCPPIADALAALQLHEACLLARMSGSGSACFALFHHAEQANHAAEHIRQQFPDWWVRTTSTF